MKNALDDRSLLWTGYDYRCVLKKITKMEYLEEILERFGVSCAIDAAEWWLEENPDDTEAEEIKRFIEKLKSK